MEKKNQHTFLSFIQKLFNLSPYYGEEEYEEEEIEIDKWFKQFQDSPDFYFVKEGKDFYD